MCCSERSLGLTGLKGADLYFEAALGWSCERENKAPLFISPLFFCPAFLSATPPGCLLPAELLVEDDKPHRTSLARTQDGVSGICSRYQSTFNFMGEVSWAFFPWIDDKKVPNLRQSEDLEFIKLLWIGKAKNIKSDLDRSTSSLLALGCLFLDDQIKISTFPVPTVFTETRRPGRQMVNGIIRCLDFVLCWVLSRTASFDDK